MFDFGSIVFVSFPFTDLSDSKLRPALVVSRDNDRRADLVLAFITSRSYAGTLPDSFPIAPGPSNGLKVPSVVRFDKLVTLDKRLVVGELGNAESDWLTAARAAFHGVFGFGPPQP
ncbi:type II toxin-antitoxin system PemK/MazF family toxin [Azospirillum sp. B2RO_4]|uniref:type II toxin-antitoxin system PemK/MazF family toxin n=1 Tax=Azospirillum sp. B2RO_4 TaxID=3027796 RepID=UPI003DA7EFCA